jgi:hypothetical protein
MIKDVISDSTGSKIIAIILGVGLAAIFRRSCRGDKCVVVTSPDTMKFVTTFTSWEKTATNTRRTR